MTDLVDLQKAARRAQQTSKFVTVKTQYPGEPDRDYTGLIHAVTSRLIEVKITGGHIISIPTFKVIQFFTHEPGETLSPEIQAHLSTLTGGRL